MITCDDMSECGGVTFSHKYWGGSLSKGFYHGYGYQLRKGNPIDDGRQFEFSYVKRLSDLCKI